MMRFPTKSKASIAFVLLAAILIPAIALADAVDDEYTRRFKAMERTDVSGHLELAKWCRDKERWDLVAKQCRFILNQNPHHAQAKLLLETAQTYLANQQRDASTDAQLPQQPGKTPGKLPRLLTDAEIQNIRLHEMKLDNSERTNLRIDRDALRDFFDRYQGSGGVPADSRDFFRMDRMQQAELMFRTDPERYADKITVLGDPARLREFQRDVVPIVIRNCATSDCHGGPGAGGLQLHPAERSSDPKALYSNFYILHEYKGPQDQRLIDRDNLQRSMLLTAGLAPSTDETLKAYNHPTDLKPPFDSEKNRDYLTIYNWLRTLSIERPDYGIQLEPTTP